ncbi:MAG: DNA-3-methyladenine glycosylase I [Candidatus Bathyarchaeia archaeon]|jgi:DNA-3-methyladenine glycosylase I
MPKWWYRERRPPNDDAYFENMSRVIFQAGLNWQVVDKKWQAIREAFYGFDIKKVAQLTDADVAQMLKNPQIIRHKSKIQATIQNARNFQAIEKVYGPFPKYLESLDKTDNYDAVVKDLIAKFKWLGPSSAETFLYTVGEDIDVWEH